MLRRRACSSSRITIWLFEGRHLVVCALTSTWTRVKIVPFIFPTLPFAGTHSERETSNDPRPSIAERYETKNEYVTEIRRAAERLVEQRLLLEQDVDLYVEMAQQQDLGL